MASVAIAIGVKNARLFRALPGAWTGVARFTKWAKSQGFSVSELTDEQNPVTRKKIFNEINSAIQPRNLDRLFIYFAGHGMAAGIDLDYWILSDGIRDPGDIVDVGGSIKLARLTGIPHIAFFGDACRTIFSSRYVGIAGNASPIFPITKVTRNQSIVDVFYGSQTTLPSYEIQKPSPDPGIIDGHGVFTTHLMDALEGLDVAAVVRDPASKKVVVTAHSLAGYLRHKVPDTTSRRPNLKVQRPDCRPESTSANPLAVVSVPDKARFAAQAQFSDGSPARGASLKILQYDGSAVSPFSVCENPGSWRFDGDLKTTSVYGIEATLAGYTQEPASPDPLTYLRVDTNEAVTLVSSLMPGLGAPPATLPAGPALVQTRVIDLAGRVRRTAPGDGIFEVASMDVLTGGVASELRMMRTGDTPAPVRTLGRDEAVESEVARVARLAEPRNYRIESGFLVFGPGLRDVYVRGGGAKIVELPECMAVHVKPAATSCVLEFDGGRFVPLAVFREFVGTVSVGPSGVDHVSYLPAQGSRFDTESAELVAHTRQLLALYGAVARTGRFEVLLEEPADSPLRKLPRYFDPVLGIYFAYGFLQLTWKDEDVKNNRNRIEEIVRHFTDRQLPVPYDVAMLSGYPRDKVPRVPGCPMLTRGWTLLGHDDELDPVLREARGHLALSMWTTVGGEAGLALALALKEGRIE